MPPIGVVIPTRNSRPYLPEHLAGIQSWADLVEEVVVVDSFSEDGTLDYVRQHLRHPRLRLLSHPPGLYASWNHGIAQLETTFAYIATVGDTITREGLLHLYETAVQTRCDVCCSRPQFVDTERRELDGICWPIHRIIENLGIIEPRVLHPAEVLYYAVTSVASAVLGSSASNLYRTALLWKYPFPTAYKMAGDTAWGLMHWNHATWCVTPRQCARFLFHPPADTSDNSELCTRLVALARDILRQARENDIDLAGCAELEHVQQLLHERELCRRYRRQLHQLRERPLPWILNWRAWQARWRRNQHQKKLVELEARGCHPTLLSLWCELQKAPQLEAEAVPFPPAAAVAAG